MGLEIIDEKKEKIVSYEELTLFWIIDFYDVPLSGLCIVNKKLHKFKIKEFPNLLADDISIYYTVYSLSYSEKIKCMLRKWAFEFCVGTHMSYYNKKQERFYKLRKPEWFWKIIKNIYYKIKNIG